MPGKYKDTLISLAVIFVGAILFFGLFYRGEDPVSKLIRLSIAAFIITVFAAVGGISYIINQPKGNFRYSFGYNFFATLNLSMGLIGLLFTEASADFFFILIIVSTITGFLMYNEMYFSKETEIKS